MDKRPIFLLVGLLAASAVLAQAFRWVDEDGVVHYSDRPQPGAEEIVLPRANTTSVRRISPPEPSDQDGTEPEAPFRYEDLEIVSPAADETLWNIEGVLSVSLALSPGLKSGHRVRVYFDGEARFVTGTSFQVSEVHRGTHNLQAEVLDETGKLMIRSQPLQFHVQQSRVNF